MATDYNTGCGGLALSFMQMLAATIRGYRSIDGVTHYRLNTILSTTNCTELEDFLDCDTSHLDPERQLVENVFALDDCGLLAMKIFNNQDNDWSDYSDSHPLATVCNEVPQSFIQLLARTIVKYDDHNMINAVIDSGACADIEQLLDCNVNAIESERLLVANVFATDDCDRLLIKLFDNASTMTDYHTECTEFPESFYELLARCIVLYDGHYYINVAGVSVYCDDLLAFWTCANNHIEPERALVENVFCTDSCGNLALKLLNNAGDSREQ
jgi:hypothetical protein